MSRRLVLRVPAPNATPSRPTPAAQTPEDVASEPEAGYSGGDAMDVDEAGEGDEEGEEVEDEGEVGEEEEGVEDEEGEMQDEVEGALEGEGQEEGEGEGEEVEVEVEAEAEGGERGRGKSRARGQGRGRGRGRGAAASAPRLRGRGRGRPRGRPRGPGRGRGTGRGKDGSPGDTPEEYSGPKPFRVVNGQPLFLKNDELTTEDDEKGDQKIDAQGHLLGGREFKAPTFGSPWREDPDRQYMLSIDAARTSGFRDSLYYFRRNLQLVKLPLSQAEKEMLIDIGRLPNSLKSRSVTLVTARSAYKLHGAKMIKGTSRNPRSSVTLFLLPFTATPLTSPSPQCVGGRWVTDDYYESRSLAEGRTPGDLVGEITQEPVDPEQHHTSAVAPTTSASAGVYRVGGPSTLYGGAGDDIAPGMEIRLAAVREADRELARMRRAAITASQTATGVTGAVAGVVGVQPPGVPPTGLFAGVGGVGVPEPLDGDSTRLERRSEVADEVYVGEPPLGWYEPHTGVWHYRADTQPTRAKLTHAPPTREALIADGVLGAAKVGSNSWGIASVKTFMELPDRSEKPPGEFIWEG